MQIDVNTQRARWSAIYSGPQYYYGFDAGPVARRAVRYHQPLNSHKNPTALDVGCGEGQDVIFLAELGYDVTGVDFVPDAIEKAKLLVGGRDQPATLHACDLREWDWSQQFDLVLAVNSLQFLGADAADLLPRVLGSVAVGGLLGLSLFACETGSQVRSDTFFISQEELLNHFDCYGAARSWQMLETSNLWQWNTSANQPQPFVTVIAQKIR